MSVGIPGEVFTFFIDLGMQVPNYTFMTHIFRFSLLLIFILLNSCISDKQYHPGVKGSYNKLNTSLLAGWNTFDNRNVLTHVLLPDEFLLQLSLEDTLSGRELPFSFTGNGVPGSEMVRTLAHTPDGSYTALQLNWNNINIKAESVSENRELFLIITPVKHPARNPGLLIARGLFEYEKMGNVELLPGVIEVRTSEGQFNLYIKGHSWIEGNKVLISLAEPVTISTMDVSSREIQKKILTAEEQYLQKRSALKESGDAWNIIQNAVNWLVVYDPVNKRLVTPVSRPWSYGWGEGKPGGYVQFCWDNFFAAYMHSIESKDLAFNEVFQLTRIIDEIGFVPNYASKVDLYSKDRSQPPVGSIMVKEIFRRYPEKWFLEENFDRLLSWNRWWSLNRDNKGFLSWGSDPFDNADDHRQKVQNVHEAASNESGLDNSPMYDEVPFDTVNHMLAIADVGLMSLYIADCEALADLALVLRRTSEVTELRERAEKYRKALKTLWHEDKGIFLNKRTDTGEWSYSISPTNFYPLLARAATQKQAERMIKEHFYNPDEFWGEFIMPSIARNDKGYTGRDYWRGSIWAPMNFLVYLGLRNYDLSEARADLAEKSMKLLRKNWESNHFILENYHAETGSYPGYRSEYFYHWGALLGMINLIENGVVEGPERRLKQY